MEDSLINLGFGTNAGVASGGIPLSGESDSQPETSPSETSPGAPVSKSLDCKLLENIDSDAYKCSSEKDCIIYIDKCCSILSKAINKNYKSCIPEGDVDLFGKPCGEEICPGSGTPIAALCANNKCMLGFDNVTSAYTIPTVTCTTDDDCELSLCNCQCQKNGTDNGICAMIMPASNCIDNVGISGCKCTNGECEETAVK